MTTTIILSLIACTVGFLMAWLWQSKKNIAEISVLETDKNAEIARLENNKNAEIALMENKKVVETAILETENKNLTEKLQQQKIEINELQTRLMSL